MSVNNLKPMSSVYPSNFSINITKNSHTLLCLPPSKSNTAIDFSDENKLSSHLLYEFYPGNNRFFLGGRLMAGPIRDVPTCCYGFCLVLSITIFYWIFIAPELCYNGLIILPILSIIFFMLTIIFLFFCNCVDPGVIPRRYLMEIQGHVPKKYVSCGELVVGGEKKYRFCDSCQIFRPPKSSHCRLE